MINVIEPKYLNFLIRP